jgi:hypothetical protein
VRERARRRGCRGLVFAMSDGGAGRCATDNGLGNPVRRKHCNACLRLRTTKIIVSGPIELRVNGPTFEKNFYSRIVFRFRAWRRRDKGSRWNCPIFAGQRIVETGHSVGAHGDARNTRRRVFDESGLSLRRVMP